ncbi:FtsW/RodA/SpoVE family cell cycle protein [Aeribacillus pallidus]|uniref:FtsW/RodA/SpoVE family cell cycle protein n=1 Tax=Aeribacillus pallidus TaxID=33936 RepID=UPI001D4628A7|nr:rod shape-determining protein RodA [Bacillus sp. (in: firmicutes)]
MTSKNTEQKRFNIGLIFVLLFMGLVSCLAIYSAQTTGQYGDNFLMKQIVWYIVGSCIIIVVMRFDPEQLYRLSWYAYGFGIFLLALLMIAPSSIAPVKNGAKSWFIVPGLGSLQPSEFVKVFLILALARTVVRHYEKFTEKTIQTDFWLLIKIGLVTSGPLLLVMMQPDLGTSLVLLSIMLGIIFVSGITWRILLPLFGVFTSVVGVIFYLVLWHPDILEKYLNVKPYQFGRIYSWLDPYNYQSTSGYQLIRSLLAIGSGETIGKGYNNREVYLPESHTDFIFSVIGEEFGFIGASIVVGLFFMLIYFVTKVGLESVNPYESYICSGVIAMITFHVFQNIGMSIGLLPITGIPLPFISYGGSSLMGNMLAMGLIFSVQYHNKRYMFSSRNEV